MSYVKTAVCASLVLGSLVMATPALATEFIAARNPNPCSEAAPCATFGKGFGTADEEHPGYAAEFQLGAFNILCANVHTSSPTVPEGAFASETSETFKTEVKFAKCLTVARFGHFIGGITTKFNEGQPNTIEYRPNEELPGGVEGGTAILGEARASLTIAHKICKIGWGGQVVKSKKEHPVATFETKEEILKTVSARFPEGIRNRLEITNEFKGIEFEYEEGQCVGEGGFEESASKTEGKTGNFNGKFLITLKEGSVSAE
jgi:hypothetical protein